MTPEAWEVVFWVSVIGAVGWTLAALQTFEARSAKRQTAEERRERVDAQFQARMKITGQLAEMSSQQRDVIRDALIKADLCAMYDRMPSVRATFEALAAEEAS